MVENLTNSFRRSATRLLYAGDNNGQADLRIAVEEWNKARLLAASWAEAQCSAAEHLFRWSRLQQNAAIRDLGTQCQQLMLLWAHQQVIFSQQTKQAMQQLESLMEVCKTQTDTHHAHSALERQERNMRKQVQRGPRLFRRGGDQRLLEHQLNRVERELRFSGEALKSHDAEHELAKLVRFKGFEERLASAYLDIGRSTEIIFQAQSDIVTHMNIDTTAGIEGSSYTQARFNRDRVALAKRSIKDKHTKFNSSGNDLRLAPSAPSAVLLRNDAVVDPPPPYTAFDMLKHV